MSYRLISQSLYEKYHAADRDIKTSVTSSYWDAHGQNVTVKNQDGNLQHNNPGFISAQRSTTFRKLLNLPIRILLHSLLKKYEARGSTIDKAKLAVNAQKVLFEFNHAKQVLIYDLISSFGLFSAPRTVCIIGDGYGFLGSLIKLANPETRLIFVNLGRNLLIDLLGFQKVHPESSPVLASSKKDIHAVTADATVFLEAEKFELLSNSTISLFINIASMQEMDHNIIERYFRYMRSSRDRPYFYCCNREEKMLPNGEKIRFLDYPWGGSEILLDEICAFYKSYPSVLPPVWRPFDGPHRHRLVRL